MTKGYYDIEQTKSGFDISYKLFDKIKEMSFEDVFYNDVNGKLFSIVFGK